MLRLGKQGKAWWLKLGRQPRDRAVGLFIRVTRAGLVGLGAAGS